MRLVALTLFTCIALDPPALAAQGWNDSAAVALVSRAVARRTAVQGDSGIRSWHVRAHGVVLFLAQVGEGGTGAPRLVKADELDVEVYWSAPGRSKQVIRGWRDRRYLPTDISYHRDHLGIVTDGYGPRIRIGDGDEVKDVIHPLSVEGLDWYDFLLRDSAQISAGGSTIILDAIEVRPRDPVSAAVIGTVYLDRRTAELVRARLSFTPVSYVDRTVETLALLLDYAFVDGRVWLPWRQTIEIRRNAGWLELPYTGIIRGTWQFGDYDLDVVIPESTFTGRAIGGLGQAGDSAAPWPAPFDSALATAGPVVSEQEVAQARVEIARAIEGRIAAGTLPTRVAATSVSDIVHFDRVQGVSLGAGIAVTGRRSQVTVRPRIGVGLADGRVTGGISISKSTRDLRPATFSFYADRSIRDFSDLPVMSRALNSLTAQEWGEDHGDYLMVEGIGLRVEGPLLQGAWFTTRLGWEDPGALDISATPAQGSFRPQVDLGARGYWIGAATVANGAEGENGWRVAIEGGAGGEGWGRASLAWQESVRLGRTEWQVRGHAGGVTSRAPAWRTFVLGGRGTLLGEEYREWGGRRMGWGSLEWRIPIVVPAIPLGDFASSGRQGILAPFLAAGWAGERADAMEWSPTGPTRLSAGIALELLYRLIRIEAGSSLQTGKIGVTFDVGRAWWGVL